MLHSPSRRAPAGRARSIVLVTLAILGVAIAASVTLWPLESSSTSSPFAFGQWTGTQAGLDAADGLVPDGAAVSVFDTEVPAVGKLDAGLLETLRRTATAAEADGVRLQVNSGWRSAEYQEQLWQEAVVEYGSQHEAARWVSTPETSAHVSGDAVDIGPPDAARWLSEHGAAFGLCPVYGNEPWHFELRRDAVDDGCPPTYADPTEDPRMQP